MKARMGEFSPGIKTVLIILVVALVIISPQIFEHGSLMLYTDSLFHLNRFYDTYMQIKEHNFQPFIMMYGFNSTGRYINVLYGPALAYLNGLFLFILGSYYRFQLVTNFLVVSLGGLNCFYMLKVGQVKPHLRLYGSIIYMTSYPIFSWLLNSKFMGVGSVFMPLAVAVGIRMLTQPSEPVKISEMTIAVTVLIQVHVLSALLAIVFLLITFIYAILQSDTDRKALIQKSSIAAGLTIILTINVWLPYWVLSAQNKLLDPFPYANPQSHTLNWSGVGELLVSLLCILSCAVLFISFKRNLTKPVRFLGWLGVIVLALASGLFPWNTMFNAFKALYIIQFPFRLAPIAFLLLIYVGLIVFEDVGLTANGQKIAIIGLRIVACMAILQGASSFGLLLSRWNSSNLDLYAGYVVNKDKKTPFKLQHAFASRDLSKPWRQIAKPVTDYLPATKQMLAWTNPLASPEVKQANDLKLIKQYTRVYLNPKFTKTVKNGKIIVKWRQQNAAATTLPIVHYRGTRYVLNGKKLSANQIQTGRSGSSVIKGQPGANEVQINYHFGLNK